MTTAAPTPEFYFVASGSVTTPRLTIAIFNTSTERVDRECSEMAATLVAAGYFMFDLFDVKTNTVCRSYRVEVPTPVVTVKVD